MSRPNLRKRPRVNYYEPEEPAFDEYIYCTECADYVLEYCAIHGPLLVVPDDKVPAVTGLPAYVPRAALSVPRHFLHIAPSKLPGAGLGVFSSRTLPRGVRFGPYRGQLLASSSSKYCWQIYDKDNKPRHVVDAVDGDKSNWMRYVNCSRHYCEQNLVAFQYRGQLYYRTIRVVPRFTELLVFYGAEFALELRVDLRRYHEPAFLVTEFLHPPKPNGNTIEKIDTKKQPLEELADIRDYEKIKKKRMEPAHLNGGSDKSVSQIPIMKKPTEKAENKLVTKKFAKPGPSKPNVIEMESPSQETQDAVMNLKHNTIISEKLIESKVQQKEVARDSATKKKRASRCISYTTTNTGVDNLNIQTKTHTGEKPFKCPECEYRCSQAGNLKTHLRTHTGEKPFKCPECEYRFSEAGNFKTHLRTHTGEKPFKCPECEYRFSEAGNLKTHLRTHTGEKPFKCPECEYRFSEAGDLKTHLRTHTGEKPFKCSECEYRCSEAGSLKTHLRTHTGEKPFKCPECEYRCIKVGSLKRHLRTHTGEKPFKCSECEYRCSQAGHLKTHLRTHTGEKPFKCPECEYRCSRAGNLKTHLRTHTGEKPFKCPECEYRCSEAGSLKTHLRTHTGEKPFKCPECEYRCIKAGSLKRHLRTHTGEKPFKCPECEYRCSEAGSLKRHLRTHTGEKLFKCPECEYRCRHAGDLKKRLRTHTGAKPFKRLESNLDTKSLMPEKISSALKK